METFNEIDRLGFNGIKLKGKCANLESFPRNINKGSLSGHVVTLPDMHGNAIKLIYYLISLGIIKHLTGKNYSRLFLLYKRSWNSVLNDSTTWIHLIDSLEFDPEAVGRLILIGDTLADRGNNDLYTECVLHALMTKVPNVTLIMSNHDAHNFTRGRSAIPPDYSCSYYGGKNSIKQHKTQHNTYIKTILSNLKLLDYELCGDGKIIIYSHAMIPNVDKTIQDLASELNVTCHGNTAIQLAETIEKINTEFKKQYFRKDSNGIPHMKYKRSYENRFIWKFFWLRTTDYLNKPGNKYVLNKNVQIVHGHDQLAAEGCNLDIDNELGKSPEDTTGTLIFAKNDPCPIENALNKIMKIPNEIEHETEELKELLENRIITLSYILNHNESETQRVASYINNAYKKNIDIKAFSKLINTEITNTANKNCITTLYSELNDKIKAEILKEAYGSSLTYELLSATYLKILASSSVTKITNYLQKQADRNTTGDSKSGEVLSRFGLFTNPNGDSQAAHTTPQKTPNNNA